MKVLNPKNYGGFITPKNDGNVDSHGNAGFAVVSNVSSELRMLKSLWVAVLVSSVPSLPLGANRPDEKIVNGVPTMEKS